MTGGRPSDHKASSEKADTYGKQRYEVEAREGQLANAAAAHAVGGITLGGDAKNSVLVLLLRRTHALGGCPRWNREKRGGKRQGDEAKYSVRTVGTHTYLSPALQESGARYSGSAAPGKGWV